MGSIDFYHRIRFFLILNLIFLFIPFRSALIEINLLFFVCIYLIFNKILQKLILFLELIGFILKQFKRKRLISFLSSDIIKVFFICTNRRSTADIIQNLIILYIHFLRVWIIFLPLCEIFGKVSFTITFSISIC